ncbi:MAG TPA: polysaccharide deacetylase family protein, partial [Candidatus Ozemobacteraceae bacterium]|nr:polysaccharide deacetylase family protein [Candidatus Ozemobacteraceae bacterium]
MNTRHYFVSIIVIFQLICALSASAEAAMVVTSAKEENSSDAPIALREPPAMPMAAGSAESETSGTETEGGSVFYNRQLIQATLGKTRQVLLTFDDGPHPNATPLILDTLKKHGLKAVFFVVGMNVRK